MLIPPPDDCALFPVIVLFRIVGDESSKQRIPPPELVLLPVTMLSVIKGDVPMQRIPPPPVSHEYRAPEPFVTVNPSKIDPAPSPLTKLTVLPDIFPSMTVT